MLVTLSGIVTLVRPLQFWKALIPNGSHRFSIVTGWNHQRSRCIFIAVCNSDAVAFNQIGQRSRIKRCSNVYRRIKCIVGNHGIRIKNCNLSQLCPSEGLLPNAGDTVRGSSRSSDYCSHPEGITPMLVTLSGIVTLVRLLHPSEGLTPMLVTLSGIVHARQTTAVPGRQLSPNAGDTVGDRHARQTTAVIEGMNAQCW